MNKKEVKLFLKSLKPLDLVLVDWVDAEKDIGEGWVDTATCIPAERVFVVANTVGFYIGASKTIVRVANNIDKGNEKNYGYDDIQVANIKDIYRVGKVVPDAR